MGKKEMKYMSFSADIKKELSEINNLAKKEEVKYELLGYLLSDNILKDKKNLKFSTESEYNINRFAKLLRNVNINDFKIDIQGKIYTITIKDNFENTIFSEKNFDEIKEMWKQEVFFGKEELDKAFIKGLFLGSGSINNPSNKYHLEIKIPDNDLISKIVKAVDKYDLKLKSMDKSIYIKEGEEISKFLAFIGASKSVLDFEEVRVQRYMNNKVNRLVNCQTANLNKVINASVEQINAIKKLKETGKFNKIDKSLQELAELRLAHPDSSLVELGEMLQKPIGKSGVNYRMKKIIELAK